MMDRGEKNENHSSLGKASEYKGNFSSLQVKVASTGGDK